MSTYSKTSGIEKNMVNKDCYDRWDKICNTDAVLYHMSRLTLRVEYTKLHYYRLRFVHVTVWKNLNQMWG